MVAPIPRILAIYVFLSKDSASSSFASCMVEIFGITTFTDFCSFLLSFEALMLSKKLVRI